MKSWRTARRISLVVYRFLYSSNGGVTSALLNMERYNLGLDYYRRYPDLVKAVTAADVLKVARKYIDPDRLVIATAGP